MKNDKDQAVEKNDETVASAQTRQPREGGYAPITGRPNIDEINRRNEEIKKRESKSFYTVSGIIVLLIIAVIFLVYFFS